MFADALHMQNLTLMPISSVTDCYDADGAPAEGAASSKWPGKSPFFPCLYDGLHFETSDGNLNDPL
jgi:hypothetical protein